MLYLGTKTWNTLLVLREGGGVLGLKALGCPVNCKVLKTATVEAVMGICFLQQPSMTCEEANIKLFLYFGILMRMKFYIFGWFIP